MVIGVPDSYRGEAIKVFVKLKPGAPALTLEALRAFLADKVGRHEMPAVLEIRDRIAAHRRRQTVEERID